MLLAASWPLEAQNLSRAQAGRVAAAQCYQSCIAMDYGQSSSNYRITLDALDGEWTETNVLLLVCRSRQYDAQMFDACRASCIDIEKAYGYTGGWIRTRVLYLLNDFLREVKAAGLWNSWNRYPASGTAAFARACVRYHLILNTKQASAAAFYENAEPVSASELQSRRQEVIENEYRPEPPPFDDIEDWED